MSGHPRRRRAACTALLAAVALVGGCQAGFSVSLRWPDVDPADLAGAPRFATDDVGLAEALRRYGCDVAPIASDRPGAVRIESASDRGLSLWSALLLPVNLVMALPSLLFGPLTPMIEGDWSEVQVTLVAPDGTRGEGDATSRRISVGGFWYHFALGDLQIHPAAPHLGVALEEALDDLEDARAR